MGRQQTPPAPESPLKAMSRKRALHGLKARKDGLRIIPALPEGSSARKKNPILVYKGHKHSLHGLPYADGARLHICSRSRKTGCGGRVTLTVDGKLTKERGHTCGAPITDAYIKREILFANVRRDALETETARVQFLMREMRKGRGERRQRALQPTLIRHILSRYPDQYLKRRPSPRLALLKDLTTAIDKRPYARTAKDE